MIRVFVAALLAMVLLVACDNEDGRPGATPTLGSTVAAAQVTATTDEPPTATIATASPGDGLVALLIEGAAATAEVRVELARTSDEISMGLMNRESLADDRGMLFIFEQPSNIGFWMRNTLIPLDIAYLAEDGRIREIRHGEPLDETILRPELPYSFVLEVNAGWFSSRGLGVGDRVVIPDLTKKG